MGANVTANCVHPGIVRTRLTRDREGFLTGEISQSFSKFLLILILMNDSFLPFSDLAFFMASKLLKTIPQAAATTCYVATSSALVGVTGKYFSDCNLASPSAVTESRHEAARLWSASEEMTAVDRSPEID